MRRRFGGPLELKLASSLLPFVVLLVPLGAAGTEQPQADGATGPATPTLSATEGALEAPSLVEDSKAILPETSTLSGEVKLELSIDSDGRVSDVLLLEGAHPELDAAAVTAARGLRFSPARLRGEAIAVRLPFTYRFEAVRPAREPPPAEAIVEKAPPRSARVSGAIRAKGTRRPLAGAVITFDGTGSTPIETDAEGRFSAEVPPGERWVRISAQGHKPAAFRETLREGEALELRYALEPLWVNPYETVVRADRERTVVSRVSLSEQELREVPGTMGDPFRVVTLLPGVATPISGIAYPIVRGSQPAATGYYVDGIRVPILFHLFLGPSVVHPDFIDGIDFYPGAPPVEFGRNLGGVINGQVSRPHETRLQGSAYLDFINAGLFVERPFPSTGTSVSLSGRVSYTGWLTALAVNNFADLGPNPPEVVLDFWDYQARVEQRLPSGRLRLLAFGSSDRFGAKSTGPASIGMMPTISFHRFDLRYQRPLGAKAELEVAATYGIDHLGMDGVTPEGTSGGGAFGTSAGEFGFHLDDQPLAARAKASFELSETLRLKVGGDLEHRQSQVRLRGTLPVNSDGETVTLDHSLPLAIASFGGVFAQLAWEPEGWSITPGLRFDAYHLRPRKDFLALEPRVVVRRELGEALTLKGGAGLFHMPPTTLINVPAVSVSGLQYGLQQALQLDLGAEWKPRHGLEVTADVYFNPLLRAVELDPFQPQFDVPPVVTGNPEQVPLPVFSDPSTSGLSYGFDLMIRHPIGGSWFGWLAYSFNNSFRRTTFYRRDATGLEVGDPVTADLPFVWEQAHVLNGVLSYKFPGNYTLGVVAHFNTGRPEGGGVSSRTHVLATDPESGLQGWTEVDPDRVDRLPSFFRIDFRAAKAWAFDTFALEVYLDFLNVSLSREVLSYSYRNEDLSKVPFEIPLVLPSLGVKGSY